MQVRASTRWTKVLEVALTVGNFVNGNSKVRCNAAGIRIESLVNIADTKTVDNKGNLLQYMCQVLEKHAPDALSLSADFPDAKLAAALSLATLMEDANHVRNASGTLVRAKASVPETGGADMFHSVLTASVVAAHERKATASFDGSHTPFFVLSFLNSKCPLFCFAAAVVGQKEWHDLAAAYGEDPKTAQPEEFFKAIVAFLAAFDKARKEVIEKRQKAAARETKRQATDFNTLAQPKVYAANSALESVLAEQQKQAEIARRAAEAISADPLMTELMSNMAKVAHDRRTLRQKKRLAKVVVEPGQPEVEVPLSSLAQVFEPQQPKMGRVKTGVFK